LACVEFLNGNFVSQTFRILGADFLSHFALLVDLKNKRLIDNVTGLTRFGKILVVNHFTVCTTSSNSPYQKLLTKFPNLTRFASISTVKSHCVEHHILTESKPIFCSPRRLSPEKLKFAKAEFVYLVEQGICRSSSSTWVSPLHMVPKLDNSWRLCGDYRSLNTITIPNRYLLPHIQDFTVGLRGMNIFSKIDLVKAYYQVSVKRRYSQDCCYYSIWSL